MDAKALGTRTLYVAHRQRLPFQTLKRFEQLWPEVSARVYSTRRGKPASHVVLSTIQAVASNLDQFDPQEFGYLIVDEAHHAAADTYRQVIAHFKPQFLLGLTATPERMDNRSILDIFRQTAHRLELEEAICRGLLVPIRCVRVKTNVDLTKVRFNGIDYRLRDLETALRIPSRDALVAKTYADHTIGRPAVCFCVDVNHAERMALAFSETGARARSISGRMCVGERDEVLNAYERGELNVLCACDILNEGWDSPHTEVLLMARPTLSKVVYVQQLGRGTRKSAGKKELLVFDFIDNTTRYAQALSVHRLFKKREYRPGALVVAPDLLGEQEDRIRAQGGQPPVVVGLHLYAEHLEIIDVFRWQDEAEGMIQASELAIELQVDDATIRERVRRSEMTPDLAIEIGSREYYYFKRERIPELQKQYGVEPLTDENIRALFLAFVETADMSASYKPVLLLGMLRLADKNGRVRVADLVAFFRDFYLRREQAGVIVEAPDKKMVRVADLADLEIEQTMLSMPFEKFERKRFFRRLKELSMVRFAEPLWRSLASEDVQYLQTLADNALEAYYRRVTAGPRDASSGGATPVADSTAARRVE
jgi:superfamily II DNA or RNA helicase